MILDKEVNRVFGFSPNAEAYVGYLICDSCKGYYRLKDNESPDDFLRCECGGDLKYHKNIDNLLKVPQILDIYDDTPNETNEYNEYEELQQIVDFLRTKAIERKKFLEELCKRVTKQEELLNEIKNGSYEIKSKNGSIWDIIEEVNIKNNIDDQKKVIDSNIENEDRFLSLLNEKRNKKSGISGNIYPYGLAKLSIVVLLIMAVSILFLYILK